MSTKLQRVRQRIAAINGIIVEAAGAFSDSWAREHARKWAENHFNDSDRADEFVAWLQKQPAHDQDYIYKNGYASCANRFESELNEGVTVPPSATAAAKAKKLSDRELWSALEAATFNANKESSNQYGSMYRMREGERQAYAAEVRARKAAGSWTL